MNQKSNRLYIYDLDHSEFVSLFKSWNEPAYRADQVWRGIYRKLWVKPQEFSSLPISLRDKLGDRIQFEVIKPIKSIKSKHGHTTKTLFQLHDGYTVETVLMKYQTRRTLCISTQVGCAMGCVFCATGQMGFKRNLSNGEIVAQVLFFARELSEINETLTNVVVMGMGEPFHNYEATMEAIDRLNDKDGFDFGARRFTISTVGLVPLINRFASEKRQVNLAISLHAANNSLRESMLPINRKYDLDELISACRDYVIKTGRRITFEWALIRDVNDSREHASELVRLLHGLLCHVNVIPLNPTEGFDGLATTQERANSFKEALQSAGIPCTIRIRRGIDIQAGCGQLASESV